MNRRKFLKAAAAIPALSIFNSKLSAIAEKSIFNSAPFSRVRPGDPLWPSEASWDMLKQKVGGRLIKLESPLSLCQAAPDSASCNELFRELKNPYYIGDTPALTQTTGWVDAWTSKPSTYAVEAANVQDVVAAVNFARENNLLLVIKGGGHSYQGTSNSADSLLIWTRAMNDIELNDNFVAQNCDRIQSPQPAVTVGSGAIWMHIYNAVTTQAGKYVQGGGCATVGVAGLIQSGGFGSFSKNYGTAAAGLLEAEIVTADGVVRIANECTNPDLFWGLKGGGGGSLGIVTKLTLRTRELPDYFGGVIGTVNATSDAAFHNLISKFISFYNDQLFNPHWGEQVIFNDDNTMSIAMVFQGLDQKQAESVWKPFMDSLANSSQDFTFEPLKIIAISARHFWDAEYLKRNYPQLVISDDRPGAPEGNVFWTGTLGEVGQYLHGYTSVWLPDSLLKKEKQSDLADAIFQGSRYWGISLNINKGLAGSPENELIAAKNTAMNPAVLNSFALAIIAGSGPPAFPGIPGHEPDMEAARKDADNISKSTDELLKIIPNAGSYVSESDFFLNNWQESFWGSNFPRLAAVKKKYDPDGLFFVHHGVGSDEWSADGFERVKER
jgi:FAD/FMN-containing dehydrogenase